MKTLREINPSTNFSRKKNRMLDQILLFEPFFGQLAWEWLKKKTSNTKDIIFC